MSRPNPCKSCTPETGRAPGCHTAACPNGWYEYEQERRAQAARERTAYEQDNAVNGVLMRAAARSKARWKKP